MFQLGISMRKPCCEKKETNKGAWSREEDQKLVDYIRKHGEGCWRSISEAAGLLRCGKSCRLRWVNYLRPDLKRGNFGEDEEDLIIKLHALLGNRWSLIAGRLPGRTDNEVKNYWNTHLRLKLLQKGIDPNNHRVEDNHVHSKPSRGKNRMELEPENKKNQDIDSTCDQEMSSTISLPDLNLALKISLPVRGDTKLINME